MKINIITSNNQYGLTNDLNILVFLIKKHFGNIVEIYAVNFFEYKCNYADINIFVELVSNILMKYAPVNILIPNQEWYYRSWIPYINSFDMILVKTKYAQKIFRKITSNPNTVKYIGWGSKDRYDNKYKKDYNKCLHLCGKSIHKQTQRLINMWESDMPDLTICYNPKFVTLLHKNQENINYITERLNEEELIKLMNVYGIHICCSDTEGFGHYIHEAKSCKAVVISTSAPPMCSYFRDGEDGFLVSYSKKIKIKEHLGSKYIFDISDMKNMIKKMMKKIIKNTIKNTLELNPQSLSKIGERARKSFFKTCQDFDLCFRTEFGQVMSMALKKSMELKKNKKSEINRMKEMSKDHNLPSISIITPTYNRRHMFKLAIQNWNNINYPSDKLEWIIVDDGEDKVYDMIPQKDKRVKYYAIDQKVPIGHKRNLCVGFATNEIIVCMDDDDYYPPNSFKIRVLELLKSGKKCVSCTIIGCFHITKLISMVNVPPHHLSFEERISEATLCFYKNFWEQQPFNNNSECSEAKDFLSERFEDYHEISWESIIVALLHSRNTSNKITIINTPNGCHYDWNDELFLFITNLENELE